MAEATVTCTYKYASVVYDYLGHQQVDQWIPLTTGVMPLHPRLLMVTLDFDYVVESSAPGSRQLLINVYMESSHALIHFGIRTENSSSGHAHRESQSYPNGVAGFNTGQRAHLWGSGTASHYDAGENVRVTMTNIVVTATVAGDPVPTDPPKPPPGKPPGEGAPSSYYALEVLNKPTLASGGSIAGNIEQVFSPSGNRDLTGISVFKIEIVTPAAEDTPIAVAFAVVGGSDPKTKTATMVAGVAPFNEPLNAALAAGEYRYRIECTSNCIVNQAVIRSPIFYYKGSGLTTFRYLEWTTQPPNDATPGTPMPNIVVKSVNDAGTVQTTASGTCTVANFSFAGPPKNENLQGTKTVPFVAGVATYTGLIHTQNGRYFLKVNAPTAHRENWSEVTNVAGEAPTTPGLRQMHSEDAQWRITTGLTAPTFTTPTYDQLQILDGDFAVSAKVTGEGIRNVFVKPMFLRKISVKYQVSSLAALPTVKFYTSTDATTPISGTWTLLATVTPNSTKVEIRAYVPSAAVYTTGLWVTIDKNGGSAVIDWYSVQVVGDYVKPDFSISTLNTGEVDVEYISIPSPFKNLQGAQTVTRDVIITNNTATDYAAVVQAVPARYGGDSKVTGEISVKDPTTGATVYTRAFPAGAGQVLRLRYEITKADNDLSGLHYIKVKVKEYELGMSYFWNHVSSSRDWLLGNAGTSAQIATAFVNIAYQVGEAGLGTHDPYVYVAEANPAIPTFWIRRLMATTGAVVGIITVTGIGLVNSIPYIFNDTLYLLPFSVTGTTGYVIPNISTVATGAVIDGLALANFPMTPMYVDSAAVHYVTIDPGAPTWVSLRTPHTTLGGQLVSHSPESAAAGQVWQLDAAHRAHANFGATSSRSYCFDYATGRIWRFRTLVGGLIGVESYTTPGGTSAVPREADIYLTITAGTLVSAQQCFIRGTKIYVVFDRRYMYSYDLPTMTNQTLIWDHGSSWIDPGQELKLFEF